MIKINSKEYAYDEQAVINLPEGLIGFPEMRRAALIPLEEFQPFCWLASLDDEKNRFIVVNPREIYSDFETAENSDLNALAIVKISSDWEKTTVNLRAPIFFDQKTKRASQVVLSESNYQLAETLPQN